MELPVWPGMAMLRRELRTTLRGRLSFLGLLTVLLGVLGMLYLNYPMPNSGLAAVAQFSNAILAVVGSGLALAAFIFVCPLAAIAIAGERERDTYTLLHLTLVPPRSMLIAKWLNSVGYFLFLVVGIVPVIGVVFFLVGVDVRLMASLFALVLSFAVLCAAVGVCCSAWSHGSTAAVVKTYVVTVCLCVLLHVWWPCMEILGIVLIGMGLLWTDSPIGHFMESKVYGEIGDGPLQILDTGFARYPMGVYAWPLIMLSIAFILFLCALPGIRRFRPRRRKPEAKPVDNFSQLVERRQKFPYYLIDPLKRKPPIPDGRNPMLVREIRWGLMGKVSRMVRAFYLALMAQMIIGTIALLAAPMNFSDGVMVAFIVDIVLLMFIAPVLTAGALAREVEQGNMDLLRTTLLTPSEILFGKLSSAVLSLAPIVAGILPVMCLFLVPLFLYSESMDSVIYGIATLAVCLAFSVVVGLFASTVFRRTSYALLLSYGVMALAIGVITAIGWGLCESLFPYQESLVWVEVTHLFSPVVSYFDVAQHRGYYQKPIIPAGYIWGTSMLFYSVLTAALLLFTIQFFARKRMRDV